MTNPTKPQTPEGAQDDAVTVLYRRFKDWARRGFGPDDVTWCEVKAEVDGLIQAAVEAEAKRCMADVCEGCREGWPRFQGSGDGFDHDDPDYPGAAYPCAAKPIRARLEKGE